MYGFGLRDCIRDFPRTEGEVSAMLLFLKEVGRSATEEYIDALRARGELERFADIVRRSEDSAARTVFLKAVGRSERRERSKRELLRCFGEGDTLSEACARAGISRPTLYKWRREDGGFSEEVEEGLFLRRGFNLLRRARRKRGNALNSDFLPLVG